MLVKPLRDKILVKPESPEETFAGGALILPETARRETLFGTVVASGPGINRKGKRVLPEIEVGSRVICPRLGDTIEVDRVSYRIVAESEILAVVE